MYLQLPGQSSFHHSGNTKKLGTGCKQSEEQAPQEKKMSPECCGLACDLRISPVFVVFPCVDMSVLSQEWIVYGCLGKLLCSVCALNTCKILFSTPTFQLICPVITVSHSTVF